MWNVFGSTPCLERPLTGIAQGVGEVPLPRDGGLLLVHEIVRCANLEEPLEIPVQCPSAVERGLQLHVKRLQWEGIKEEE